jgi:hypothetical protein
VVIDTLATLPSSNKTEDRPKDVTEPIAVSQRVAKEILIPFWYIATADCTIAPEEGTQQENEESDAVWVDSDDVSSILTFGDDRRIAQAAITAVRSGVIPAS